MRKRLEQWLALSGGRKAGMMGGVDVAPWQEASLCGELRSNGDGGGKSPRRRGRHASYEGRTAIITPLPRAVAENRERRGKLFMMLFFCLGGFLGARGEREVFVSFVMVSLLPYLQPSQLRKSVFYHGSNTPPTYVSNFTNKN